MRRETLTPKQTRLVAKIVEGKPQKEALRLAGYKTSGSGGHPTLKNPVVKKAIAKALEEIKSNAISTKTEILERLTIIARARVKDFSTWEKGGVSLKEDHEVRECDHVAIGEIVDDKQGNKKVKLKDGLAADKELLRHYEQIEKNKQGEPDKQEENEKERHNALRERISKILAQRDPVDEYKERIYKEIQKKGGHYPERLTEQVIEFIKNSKDATRP